MTTTETHKFQTMMRGFMAFCIPLSTKPSTKMRKKVRRRDVPQGSWNSKNRYTPPNNPQEEALIFFVHFSFFHFLHSIFHFLIFIFHTRSPRVKGKFAIIITDTKKSFKNNTSLKTAPVTESLSEKAYFQVHYWIPNADSTLVELITYLTKHSVR